MNRHDRRRAATGAEPLIYTFHRAEGFYPIELPGGDAEAIANAHCNPGTREVRCALTGRLVWSDGKDGRPAVGLPS